ncbi:hypothetical protein DERF_004570 [Dermatophagoides farinae]|uniref:G-protein coupled receptors family 1 profile domain-containing protein n=1 Tax=Dermatophagoides farinae TaxID=6954 RepID=A0A922L5B6_DERFA|nr:5-hydroxytryptamine receptor 1F-like isoform X1 [Dermatophagoides farinae]XP_046911647.1 5-hydroxytryptamine receptor 1F-like isoform X1 [Dermatophagoides farinae]KAH9520886.1 hypothetical protein DERF_004570 [Dermatophagoides farinae]
MMRVVYCDDDFFNCSKYNFSEFHQIWGHKPWPEILWKSTLMTTITLVGLVSNIAVMVLVLKRPQIRQRSLNLFIVNLAMADFLTVLFIPAVSLIENIFQNYELGPLMCSFEILIKVTCILASNFSIMAISFKRFITISCITNPSDRSNHRSLLLIVTIWIVSTSLAYPLAHMRVYHERQWKDYQEKWCNDEPLHASVNYWVFLMTPLIYVPLMIMIVVYSLMIYRINRFIDQLLQHRTDHSTMLDSFRTNSLAFGLNQFGNEQLLSDDENNMDIHHQTPDANAVDTIQKSRRQFVEHKLTANKHKKALIKTMFVYCLVTLFCWLPLQVLVYYRAFRPPKSQLPSWYDPIKFFSQILLTVNAAINPFIMFGKTFLHYMNRYRVRRRQQRIKNQIELNLLRIKPSFNAGPDKIVQRAPEQEIQISDKNLPQTTTETDSNRLISLDRAQIMETLKHGQQAGTLLVIQTSTQTETITLSNGNEERHDQANEPNASTHIITKHMLQKYKPQIFERRNV